MHVKKSLNYHVMPQIFSFLWINDNNYYMFSFSRGKCLLTVNSMQQIGAFTTTDANPRCLSTCYPQTDQLHNELDCNNGTLCL